jgi:hypothetical protein
MRKRCPVAIRFLLLFSDYEQRMLRPIPDSGDVRTRNYIIKPAGDRNVTSRLVRSNMKGDFGMKYLCLPAFFALLVPLVKADEWDKRSVVTFNEPVEVPGVQNHGHGVILVPGTYVFKLADSSSDRDIVQIFNKDESQIYTTTIAIPEYRMTPTDHTVIHFEERRVGSPEAIKDWYYPGDLRGEEFLYAKPLHVMAAQTAPVTTAKTQPVAAVATAPVPAATPPAKEAAPEQASQSAPVQIAQAKPANPAPQSPPAKKLPKTASDVPLIGLIGLLSIAAGASLRKIST